MITGFFLLHPEKEMIVTAPILVQEINMNKEEPIITEPNGPENIPLKSEPANEEISEKKNNQATDNPEPKIETNE